MKVKQLVWEEVSENKVYVSDTVLRFIKFVIRNYDNYYQISLRRCPHEEDQGCGMCELFINYQLNYSRHSTIDAAKAACQAHYKALILSGLETEDEV